MFSYNIILSAGLIIFSLLLVYSIKIIPEEPKFVAQLEANLKNILKCRNENETVVVSDETEFVGRWFLSHTNAVYLASKSGLQSLTERLLTEPTFYLFASFKEQIIEYFYMINSTYMRSTTYFIIICPPNSNETATEDLLESIWNIFYFLDCFLITCSDSVAVRTYNPFFNTTILFNQNQIENCEIFTDKLKNLNGFKLKVTLFEDPPRITIRNGEFDGSSVRTMKLVLQIMNATAEVVVPQKVNGGYFGGAAADLQAYRSHISFVETFTVKMLGNDRSYSYPHQLNDYVVVVRKRMEIVDYFNVYEIFDFATWLCILMGILLTTAYRTYLDKRCDVGSSFVLTWSGITGVSLNSIFNASRKIKLVFIVWIVSCLILDTHFSSLLASKIIKPRVRQDIDTIQELKEINPKILMSSVFIKAIPKEYGISENLVGASHLERHQALENLDDKIAVVLASSVVELIRDKSHLHILKEHLLPGFAIYRFQPKSPFLKTVDNIIFKDIEYGITKFNENFTISHKFKKETGQKGSLLKFVHIKNIFLILIAGHTIATIVLFFEIFFKLLGRVQQ